MIYVYVCMVLYRHGVASREKIDKKSNNNLSNFDKSNLDLN